MGSLPGLMERMDKGEEITNILEVSEDGKILNLEGDITLKELVIQLEKEKPEQIELLKEKYPTHITTANEKNDDENDDENDTTNSETTIKNEMVPSENETLSKKSQGDLTTIENEKKLLMSLPGLMERLDNGEEITDILEVTEDGKILNLEGD